VVFLHWCADHPWFAAFMILVALSVLKGAANFLLRLFKRQELS